MNKKYYFSVYSGILFIDFIFLLYATLVCIVVYMTKAPRNPLLWCITLIPIIGLCRISWFGTIDRTGVCVYRLFRRKLFLKWNEITHWGTISKTVLKKRNVTYVYFSTMPLISAPYENMPPMSNNLMYFSYQKRLIDKLETIGKKDLFRSFPKSNKYAMSDDMQNKLIGSTILMILVAIVLTIFFIIINPFMILLLIIPLAHLSLHIWFSFDT